jgi:hypothetical protein
MEDLLYLIVSYFKVFLSIIPDTEQYYTGIKGKVEDEPNFEWKFGRAGVPSKNFTQL